MNSRSIPVFLILAVSLIIACQPGPLNLENYTREGSPVLIAVNDTTSVLNQRQLYEKLWSTTLFPFGGTIDTIDMVDFVDSLMMDTVVGLVADVDIHLSDHFAQHWGYKSRYNEVLSGAYYSRNVYHEVDIDSQMVIEYRDKHAEQFSIPEQVLVHHILVSPKYYTVGPEAVNYKHMSEEELAQLQKDQAWELYGAIKNGEPFELIAQEYSHDKMTNREGGIVGWAPRDQYRPPFDSVAFSAELNVVQEPYWDEDGWHIIKVTDHIQDGPVDLARPDFFAQVYGRLREELTRDVATKIVDSLRDGLNLEVFEEVLDQDVFRVDPQIVAAVVNQIDTIYFMDMRNKELDYRRAYGIRNTTPEIKREIIERLASQLLVIQAARNDGLDTLPEIRQVEYDLRHETCRSLVIGSRYDPTWRPSDSAIEAYYNAHITDYVIEKPIRIQTILVPDSTLAQFIYDQAASGIGFEELKKTYLDNVPGQDLAVTAIGPEDVTKERWTRLNQIPVASHIGPDRKGELWEVVKLVERKLSYRLQHARGKIVTILTQQFVKGEVKRFTEKNAPRFGVVRKEPLRKIHLKPIRYRETMVL